MQEDFGGEDAICTIPLRDGGVLLAVLDGVGGSRDEEDALTLVAGTAAGRGHAEPSLSPAAIAVHAGANAVQVD